MKMDSTCSSLVSVITPAYNAEKYILEAIHSVQSQTWESWEMIIIDDASQDTTWKLIQLASEKDERIKIFQNEVNCGVAQTRNKAIENSKGNYLAFLDSDDLWEPLKLERQILFMQNNNVVFCFTDYSHIDSKNRTQKKSNWTQERFTYSELLNFNGIGNLTVVLDIEKMGAVSMSEEGHEDYILWLSILRKGFIAHGICEVLAHHRLLDNSLSRNKWKAARWTWKIYRESENLRLLPAMHHFSHYLWHSFKKYLG